MALAVTDSDALLLAHARLEALGVRSHLFFEPDDEMGYTALATDAILDRASIRSVVSHLPMWRP